MKLQGESNNFIAWHLTGRLSQLSCQAANQRPGLSCSAVLQNPFGNTRLEGEGIHECITASITGLCR